MSEQLSTLKYRDNELECFHVDPQDPAAAWKAIQARYPALSDWGIELLRDGLDGFVQTIVVEPAYTCKDHRNLHSNFYSKKFLEVTSVCQRLHFFNLPGLTDKELLAEPEKFQDSYLGFSVIRSVFERCIGRTVIDPYKIGKSFKEGFYLLRTKFRVQINGTQFEVWGYPFISQDLDATLCAHAALWGVCRYLSERYTRYKELFPFDFIRMTESSRGRAFPYRGLTYTDYCRILTEFGTHPVIGFVQRPDLKDEKKIVQDPDVFTDLCAYVESGFPVLASIRPFPNGGQGHVVSLIGHTIDYDKKVDQPDGFLDSSYFLKQFVVVDDNGFPYELLGHDGDPENYGSLWGATGRGVSIKDIVTMTCPLPEKVFLPANLARSKALKHLQIFRSILRQIAPEPYVTRLFVTSSAAFKKQKLKTATTQNDPASSVPVHLHLPHFLWVMEVYALNEYRGGKCIAEVVLDSTSGIAEESIIYMRVGDQLFLAGTPTKFSRVEGPDRFVQYTHNLGEA